MQGAARAKRHGDPLGSTTYRRTFLGLRFAPVAPAVPLDNLLANRQADARARILTARVQALKDLKDPLRLSRLHPDPVVLHGKDPQGPLRPRRDVDARRGGPVELQRIAQQILEHQADLLSLA